MTHLKELQNRISQAAWFSGELQLNIQLKNSFEGHYGLASEDWENQVVIEIVSPEDCKIPNLKVVGARFQSIDDVAKIVLDKIENL